MSIKIKNISIRGIRGAKNRIDLPLSGKSLLLYGDNGSGKKQYFRFNRVAYTDR